MLFARKGFCSHSAYSSRPHVKMEQKLDLPFSVLSVRARTLAVVCARNELQVRQINYEMGCMNLLDT